MGGGFRAARCYTLICQYGGGSGSRPRKALEQHHRHGDTWRTYNRNDTQSRVLISHKTGAGVTYPQKADSQRQRETIFNARQPTTFAERTCGTPKDRIHPAQLHIQRHRRIRSAADSQHQRTNDPGRRGPSHTPATRTSSWWKRICWWRFETGHGQRYEFQPNKTECATAPGTCAWAARRSESSLAPSVGCNLEPRSEQHHASHRSGAAIEFQPADHSHGTSWAITTARPRDVRARRHSRPVRPVLGGAGDSTTLTSSCGLLRQRRDHPTSPLHHLVRNRELDVNNSRTLCQQQHLLGAEFGNAQPAVNATVESFSQCTIGGRTETEGKVIHRDQQACGEGGRVAEESLIAELEEASFRISRSAATTKDDLRRTSSASEKAKSSQEEAVTELCPWA